MKNYSITKRLCRAGIIASLYTVLTYVFAPFAFGPFQIRPAEALCILALIYPEAIPALAVGCALSNLFSPFALYDVSIGSLTTLLAVFVSYLVGANLKNVPLKIFVGGLPPVLFNAFVIPFVIVFLCGDSGNAASVWIAYFTYVGSFLLTQSVWVYALGTPLYLAIFRLKSRGLRFLND
jgi:uncharacterized membrane protein